MPNQHLRRCQHSVSTRQKMTCLASGRTAAIQSHPHRHNQSYQWNRSLHPPPPPLPFLRNPQAIAVNALALRSLRHPHRGKEEANKTRVNLPAQEETSRKTTDQNNTSTQSTTMMNTYFIRLVLAVELFNCSKCALKFFEHPAQSGPNFFIRDIIRRHP